MTNKTEEQREAKRKRDRENKRKKRASMSEEELEALRAKRREQERIRRANRSPEKIEADKEKARERAKRRYYSNEEYREELKARHREWYQAMKASPEKHAGFRARQRAYERQWRAQRTPEQRERDRASDRRRQRKRSPSEAEQGHQPRKRRRTPMSETITLRNGSSARRLERWEFIKRYGHTSQQRSSRSVTLFTYSGAPRCVQLVHPVSLSCRVWLAHSTQRTISARVVPTATAPTPTLTQVIVFPNAS